MMDEEGMSVCKGRALLYEGIFLTPKGPALAMAICFSREGSVSLLWVIRSGYFGHTFIAA